MGKVYHHNLSSINLSLSPSEQRTSEGLTSKTPLLLNWNSVCNLLLVTSSILERPSHIWNISFWGLQLTLSTVDLKLSILTIFQISPLN